MYHVPSRGSSIKSVSNIHFFTLKGKNINVILLRGFTPLTLIKLVRAVPPFKLEREILEL